MKSCFFLLLIIYFSGFSQSNKYIYAYAKNISQKTDKAVSNKQYNAALINYHFLDSVHLIYNVDIIKYAYCLNKTNSVNEAIKVLYTLDLVDLISARIDTYYAFKYDDYMDTTSYLEWLRNDPKNWDKFQHYINTKCDSLFLTLNKRIINQISIGVHFHNACRTHPSFTNNLYGKTRDQMIMEDDSGYAAYLKWFIDIDNMDSVVKYYPYAKTLVLNNFYSAEYYLKAFNKIKNPPLQIVEMIYEMNRIKHEMIHCNYYYEENILYNKDATINTSYDNLYILSTMLMKNTNNHELIILNKKPEDINSEILKNNLIKRLRDINPKIDLGSKNISIKVITSYKGIIDANQINNKDIQVFYKKCVI